MLDDILNSRNNNKLFRSDELCEPKYQRNAKQNPPISTEIALRWICGANHSRLYDVMQMEVGDSSGR